MRILILIVGLVAGTACQAADLSKLPPNTFVEITYTHQQPPDVTDDTRSRFASLVWNKLAQWLRSDEVSTHNCWFQAAGPRPAASRGRR
jgi:hypothetical protein